MTLRHLKIYIAVCDLGSITAASESLYIAQPSVSCAIRELEEHYSMRFFDRISRKLFITEPGEQLLSYARHIVSLFDQLEKGMREWNPTALHIGASITTGTCFLPWLSRQFSSLYPNIKLNVEINNSTTLVKKTLANQFDFSLIEGVCQAKQLVKIPFLNDALLLICGKTHKLYGKNAITPQALANLDFILREKGSGTRDLFDSAMILEGLQIQPIWESVSTEAIISAVCAGIGVSVLPSRLIEREISSGLIWPIQIDGVCLSKDFTIIHHQNKFLSHAAHAFISLCQKIKHTSFLSASSLDCE